MLGGPLDTHSSLRSGSLGLDLTSSMGQGHVKLMDMDRRPTVEEDDDEVVAELNKVCVITTCVELVFIHYNHVLHSF